VALIQLATQTTAYLFRVKFQGMRAHGGGAGTGAPSGGGGGAWTPELRHLLSDATIIKVGVGIHNDVRTLQDTYGAQVCGDATSYLDLTELVKIKWSLIRRCGLRNLAATVLGWRLSKAQQMKNWEVKEMTNAMMEYAAADAFVALDLLEAIVT
jgi:ribonuclease D